MAVIIAVVPHPDDETLSMGVMLAEHAVAGHDMHVLLLTRGTASGALAQLNGSGVNGWWGTVHTPSDEGYDSLDAAAFGQARVDECRAALDCLASGTGNPITLHEAGLTDGEVTRGDVGDAIVALADSIAPTGEVWLKGYTYTTAWEPTTDHSEAGEAVRALAAADPTRYGNVRYYVRPDKWSTANKSWDLPTDSTIAARAVNACRAYGAWRPAGGAYAIGHHSVWSMFSTVMSTPKCMYHT